MDLFASLIECYKFHLSGAICHQRWKHFTKITNITPWPVLQRELCWGYKIVTFDGVLMHSSAFIALSNFSKTNLIDSSSRCQGGKVFSCHFEILRDWNSPPLRRFPRKRQKNSEFSIFEFLDTSLFSAQEWEIYEIFDFGISRHSVTIASLFLAFHFHLPRHSRRQERSATLKSSRLTCVLRASSLSSTISLTKVARPRGAKTTTRIIPRKFPSIEDNPPLTKDELDVEKSRGRLRGVLHWFACEKREEYGSNHGTLTTWDNLSECVPPECSHSRLLPHGDCGRDATWSIAPKTIRAEMIDHRS